MAFTCPECGFRSNEVQYGGVIQDTGVKFQVIEKNIYLFTS